MGRNYILYNPFAGNKTGEESALKIRDFYKDEDCEVISVKSLKDYNDFIGGLNTEDKIVICGGDGTLNYFVNKVDVSKVKNDIYYVSTGTGDDFAFELGQKGTGIPFRINNYLVDLPKIIVKEKEYKFFLDVGLSYGNVAIELLDKEKNVIMSLTPETPEGSITVDKKQRYYMVYKFENATGSYEMRWE